jgi:gliding motility-associated-like protein
VIVTNPFSCTDTATISITVITDPVVDAGPDRVILKGQSIKLNGNVTGQGYNYSWSPATYINDIYSLRPIVNPPSDARYILTAVSSFGCKTFADTMAIKVYPEIFIPNAFTPNADGLNDTWNIPALAAYPNFELFIYDRYGKLVFNTKNSPVNWDGTYKGKPCMNGAYAYLIKTGDNRNIISGTVLIIR